MPDPADVESAVGRWLALLRDGSEEERRLARTELGLILEVRGLPPASPLGLVPSLGGRS